jgi:two-component sensor histidine kinase
MMARLGELDLPSRLAPTVPRWASQLGVALLCVAFVEVVRLGVNLVAPGSAVFALVFPAIMLATLFAGWQSGLLTGLLSIGYTFFIVYLPVTTARAVINPRLAVFAVGVSALLTVLLAEIFRRAVERATRERDREIADRDLFLAEFDHRVKNNFTIVASLLDMQRRRVADPAVAEALTTTLTRVESIARAHRHLYRDGRGQPGTVEMRDYLTDLCAALADSLLLRGALLLECDAEPAAVPRDRAVSMGLVVNELVTNAAKHAFAGRESGTIRVTFRRVPRGWDLGVADDGVGMDQAAAPAADGGLGSKLIAAFARQAGGELSVESDPSGTRVSLVVAA